MCREGVKTSHRGVLRLAAGVGGKWLEKEGLEHREGGGGENGRDPTKKCC